MMLNKIINDTQDYYFQCKQAFLYCLYLFLIQVNISGIFYLPGKNCGNAPEITTYFQELPKYIHMMINQIIDLLKINNLNVHHSRQMSAQ